MINLKIRRINSIHGSWACEEIKKYPTYPKITDLIGIGQSIEDSIDDFIRSFKILKGFIPDYKWS